MSTLKAMLWALAAAVAVGAGTALVGAGVFGTSAPSETALARGDAPRVVGGASGEGLFSAWGRPRGSAATPARGAASGAGESAASIEEELRWTEAALESSHRISEPAGTASGPAPSREPRAAAGPSLAAVALCKKVERECHSSADCCPGLACVGGVAGYGTPGRCESADDR